ncbi:venom acid phosphatase Acph-1-like [Phymastichus coffea]|uniref:venom acid phosphatase Acph-1-like n=1 Tax=Phymastichus coffea TaxID=108790 RepID=UPI00273C53A0|nr:venom acid phosphatase Acph-1-like [Phymastichus coffea]
MKLVIISYVCTFLLSSTADENCDDFKVEQIQVLFRHGARTPIAKGIKILNSTDYSVYEPPGFGELTKEGKLQEYSFGKFLRTRYANFLNSTDELKDVYGYASDTARTKMSLQLLLAGLYPPDRFARWHPLLNWSPIPYSYAPEKWDILLSACKNVKFLKSYLKIILSEKFLAEIANYSEFLDFVAKSTNGIKSLMNTIMIFDNLISNEYMKLPLPIWYTTEVRQTFMEFAAFVWDSTTATTETKRLGIGSLIKTFVENMNLNGTIERPRKIYLYGGHDMNVAMFTRSLGITELRYPLFGSAVIFEKLHDSKSHVHVRVLSWDGLGNLQALKLGNGKTCSPIADYLNIVKPVIPSAEEMDAMIGIQSPKEIRDVFFTSVNRPPHLFDELRNLSRSVFNSKIPSPVDFFGYLFDL